MADDPQKTVFISYRRKVSSFTALAIYKNLLDNGYDVFMDVENLGSGKFDQNILKEIETRTHFLVILQVGSLNDCKNEGDWLQREIEHAMDHNRNIVPIIVEGFSFASKKIQRHLTGKLSELPDYNGLRLYHDDFEGRMRKLQERFLKQPVYGPINPTPCSEEAVVQQKLEEVEEQPEPDNLLRAQEYYESADAKWQAGDYEGTIADCNEAIQLNPKLAEAYNRRGAARIGLKDFEGALVDVNEALGFNPHLAAAYNNRGLVRHNWGDVEGAIADYGQAIRLDPEHVIAYSNRASVRCNLGDYEGAIADYSDVIRLDPQDTSAYIRRAGVRYDQGDYEGAIADYTEVIRLDPQNIIRAYAARGNALLAEGDLDGAIADYNLALEFNPQYDLVYNNRGVAYERKGDYEHALADYDEALRINLQFEVTRNSRAELFKKLGRA